MILSTLDLIQPVDLISFYPFQVAFSCIMIKHNVKGSNNVKTQKSPINKPSFSCIQSKIQYALIYFIWGSWFTS